MTELTVSPEEETLVEEEVEESTSQYVTFYLNEEAFAFPMATVLEIIRVPDTVQVPMTPGSLVGLANLRGSVLPVLDLRYLLGLPTDEYKEATRVIVVDAGRPVGLVVDKVARVLNVEENQIESGEEISATIDAQLLNGVAKNIEGHDLIQLLDVEKAIHMEYAMSAAGSATAALDAATGMDALTGAEQDEEDDLTVQLVSFVVDDQEYAFDINDVEEIVRVPEAISRLPHSGHHVLGLINLRGQLLPLVSLRRMFAMDDNALDDHNRILVVSMLYQQGHRESVGIVVDQVSEVLRVPREVQGAVPQILRQGGELEEIMAVCRLEDGKRLVSVLSAAALFQNTAIQEALESCDEETMEANASNEDELMEMGSDDETQLVVFVLAEQEFAITIEAVQEITRVPEQMTKVPKTPDFIEGLVNLRGAVLPVLDMRTRFGQARMERNDRQRILVLDLGGIRTGFITDAVQEVLRLSRTLIEDSPQLSEEQSRIMGRVVNFRDQKRMIQVLDVNELLNKGEREAILESA